jgi:hypothetical protein
LAADPVSGPGVQERLDPAGRSQRGIGVENGE